MADNFDKSAILGSFLDEVDAYIPEIEAHLDQLQQVPDDETAIEEAYRRTHTIYGSAAMMEFNGLAQIAQGMETILDDALERRATLDQATIALLRRSCGRLARVAQLIRSGGSDTGLVAEDQQDHNAFRGASAGAGSASAPSGSSAPLAPAAPWNSGGPAQPESAMPREPLPDWLAAFGPGAAAGGGAQASATPLRPDSDALGIRSGDSTAAAAVIWAVRYDRAAARRKYGKSGWRLGVPTSARSMGTVADRHAAQFGAFRWRGCGVGLDVLDVYAATTTGPADGPTRAGWADGGARRVACG
jgi:chemotaxis protein histidine kinase CheA